MSPFDILDRNLLKRCLDLCKTILANSFAAEIHDVVSIVAEDAGGLIFLKNYLVLVCEDLKRILFVYVHDLTDADGKNDSSKLVYLSYYAG